MNRKEEIKQRLEKKRPTRVFSYIHGQGRIGVLLEIVSDTDFALRNELVEEFAHEVCLQIASMNPLSVDVNCPNRAAARMHIVASTKSKPELLEKIVNGKLKKWDKENTLLEMSWVKDNNQTVGCLLNDLRHKLGEDVVIKQFARFGS